MLHRSYNFLAFTYYRKQVNILRFGHWLHIDMIVPMLSFPSVVNNQRNSAVICKLFQYSYMYKCSHTRKPAHPHTRTPAPTNRYDYHAKGRCVSQKGTFTLIDNMTGLRQSLGSYYKQFSSTERPSTPVVSAPYVDHTGFSKCL